MSSPSFKVQPPTSKDSDGTSYARPTVPVDWFRLSTRADEIEFHTLSPIERVHLREMGVHNSSKRTILEIAAYIESNEQLFTAFACNPFDPKSQRLLAESLSIPCNELSIASAAIIAVNPGGTGSIFGAALGPHYIEASRAVDELLIEMLTNKDNEQFFLTATQGDIFTFLTSSIPPFSSGCPEEFRQNLVRSSSLKALKMIEAIIGSRENLPVDGDISPVQLEKIIGIGTIPKLKDCVDQIQVKFMPPGAHLIFSERDSGHVIGPHTSAHVNANHSKIAPWLCSSLIFSSESIKPSTLSHEFRHILYAKLAGQIPLLLENTLTSASFDCRTGVENGKTAVDWLVHQAVRRGIDELIAYYEGTPGRKGPISFEALGAAGPIKLGLEKLTEYPTSSMSREANEGKSEVHHHLIAGYVEVIKYISTLQFMFLQVENDKTATKNLASRLRSTIAIADEKTMREHMRRSARILRMQDRQNEVFARFEAIGEKLQGGSLTTSNDAIAAFTGAVAFPDARSFPILVAIAIKNPNKAARRYSLEALEPCFITLFAEDNVWARQLLDEAIQRVDMLRSNDRNPGAEDLGNELNAIRRRVLDREPRRAEPPATYH